MKKEGKKGRYTIGKRGITLIALVITIIILLILAGVAINAIFNQGELFNKANEAVDKWNIALKEENDVIGGLIDDLNSRQKVEVTDNIIISKIPEGSEWTKENVIINLSYENIPTGYEIQYKVGNGSWTTGTSITVEENNTTVYVRLYNKNIDDETAVNNIEITNIDKTAPTAPTSITKTENINSITVTASGGTDVGSGIAGYKYSTNGTSWTETIKAGESHTFEGIKAGTEVSIYAKTVDKVGLESSTYSSTGSTAEVTGNISMSKNPSSAAWINGNITVTLSYSNIPAGYEIQYKVGSGNWTAGTSVTVAQNNTTVTGRLYNATLDDETAVNNIEITNIDKTAPTVPTGIESSATSNSITVQASGGTDSLSGVAGYQYRINSGEWSATIANGTSHTFSELTAGTNYTIEARTVDNVGGLSGVYSVTEKTTAIAQVITETSEIYGVTKKRTAPIPVEYTVSQIAGENTIKGGLVIYQTETPVTGEKNSAEHIRAMETYNQYVWIPVDDINDMVMCKSNGQEVDGKTVCNLQLQGNELVCTTHGYTTATELTTTNIDTTGLAGRLYAVDSTYTTIDGNRIYQTNMQFTETTKSTQKFTKDSGYREPDIVTRYDKDDATSGKNYMELAGIADKTVVTFKKQLNADYIDMAKSVAKYGGFYIARYEAGLNGASKKNQDVLTSSASSGTNYLAGNTWYGLYNILRNKTGVNTNVVKSHMVWRKSV